LTYDFDFQSLVSYGDDPCAHLPKIQFKSKLVQKTGTKQTDGRTDGHDRFYYLRRQDMVGKERKREVNLREKCEMRQSRRAPTTIPTATPSTTISNTPVAQRAASSPHQSLFAS